MNLEDGSTLDLVAVLARLELLVVGLVPGGDKELSHSEEKEVNQLVQIQKKQRLTGSKLS